MNIRKNQIIVCFTVLLSFIIIICNQIHVNALKFSLNRTHLTMIQGSRFQLKTNPTKSNEIWISSNQNIASVSKGLVYAKKRGTVKITVTQGLYSRTCTITIKSKVFPKYKLTNKQLKRIATLCWNEQSSRKGAATEASLLANLFESGRGKKYGSGGKGLYNYAKNSGWFANANESMTSSSPPKTVINAVKQVLCNGKRILPQYVDEHDCISDIKHVKINGHSKKVSSKNSYKRHSSIIENRYKAKYYFYRFGDSVPSKLSNKTADPFGYMSKSKRNELGDFCYNYNSL